MPAFIAKISALPSSANMASTFPKLPRGRPVSGSFRNSRKSAVRASTLQTVYGAPSWRSDPHSTAQAGPHRQIRQAHDHHRTTLVLDIPAHVLLSEKTPCFIQLVERLVDPKTQFRRVFQAEFLADDATQLTLVPAQKIKNILLPLAPEGQDISRGNLEIGRRAHLADGDGQPVEIRIMHIPAHQHVRQGPSDEFAHAQLPLRRAGTVMEFVLGHG